MSHLWLKKGWFELTNFRWSKLKVIKTISSLEHQNMKRNFRQLLLFAMVPKCLLSLCYLNLKLMFYGSGKNWNCIRNLYSKQKAPSFQSFCKNRTRRRASEGWCNCNLIVKFQRRQNDPGILFQYAKLPEFCNRNGSCLNFILLVGVKNEIVNSILVGSLFDVCKQKVATKVQRPMKMLLPCSKRAESRKKPQFDKVGRIWLSLSFNALSFQLAHLWLVFGLSFARLWLVFSSSLAHLWFIIGSSFAHFWLEFGSSLGRLWLVFGSSLACLWLDFGSSLVHL